MAHVSVNSISRQQMANASCPAFRGGFPTESSEVKDTRRHLPVGVWVSRRRQFLDVLQHPPIGSLINGMHSSLIGGDLSVDPVLPAGVAI